MVLDHQQCCRWRGKSMYNAVKDGWSTKYETLLNISSTICFKCSTLSNFRFSKFSNIFSTILNWIIFLSFQCINLSNISLGSLLTVSSYTFYLFLSNSSKNWSFFICLRLYSIWHFWGICLCCISGCSRFSINHQSLLTRYDHIFCLYHSSSMLPYLQLKQFTLH